MSWSWLPLNFSRNWPPWPQFSFFQSVLLSSVLSKPPSCSSGVFSVIACVPRTRSRADCLWPAHQGLRQSPCRLCLAQRPASPGCRAPPPAKDGAGSPGQLLLPHLRAPTSPPPLSLPLPALPCLSESFRAALVLLPAIEEVRGDA